MARSRNTKSSGFTRPMEMPNHAPTNPATELLLQSTFLAPNPAVALRLQSRSLVGRAAELASLVAASRVSILCHSVRCAGTTENGYQWDQDPEDDVAPSTLKQQPPLLPQVLRAGGRSRLGRTVPQTFRLAPDSSLWPIWTPLVR